uniref:Uncharacterized protein n=1 Tax=Fagus sylvatica TaxID=28930 RepID=A0A2N9GLI2_FAGSY
MSSEMVGAITHDGTASFKLGRRALVFQNQMLCYGGDPETYEPIGAGGYPIGGGGYFQPIGYSPP